MPATPAVEMVAPTTESTANSIAVQDTTEKELENYTKVDKPESEIQNDMIPEELLFALTHVPQPETKTRLPDLKKDKTLQEIIKKGSPANVWNYKTRRMQYKHLTDNPRSDGKSAGTRDVSFLYDIQSHTGPPPKPPGGKFDKSSGRLEALENSNQKPTESNLAVPESIIPDEYHVVKSKAVLGLEYIDQSLTTNLEDREKTLRVFPSLNPTKRHEVVQLLKTLDYMLEKSGVDDEDVEIKGPTQVHNLIELIKKEQNVYDLVFAEVIRQVSVGCIERGQLLSKLRQKYADLLNRVPRQIRSLHVEVMAQRSLDRRLTEELLRFKTSITFLTNELQQVRAHDEQVTADAQRAEMDLAQALKESQTNANLVDEYHTLYELQRRRLEAQVNSLGNERDVWSNAAYSLSLKIMTVNSLKTAKRLHVSEKAWSKLASHFAVMLNDRDSGSLGVLQKIVERWRELMFSFNQSLTFVDKQTTSALDQIKQGIQKWIKIFDDTLIVVTSDVRSIRIPPMEMLHRLQESIREWEENLNRHIEQFGGDNLLNNQEQLTNMMKLTEEWTDVALKVYRRHKIGDQEIHPLAETMKDVNEILHLLNKQLKIRISGENGLARHMITFHMIIDSLSNKFHIAASNNESFSDSEWLQMYEKLHDYVNQLNAAISLVGEQQRDEDRTNKRPHTRIHIEEAMGKVQGWLKSSLNGIEAEDGKMIAQSSSIHNKLVGWMVQALLHLAPNFQRDADDFPVENSFISSCTETELKEKAEDISSHLATFTGYLSQCCQHIVEETAEEKRQEGEEEADYEFRDFIRLKREAREWIRTAEIILTTISKEPIKILRPEMDEVLRIERDAKTDTTPRHDSIEDEVTDSTVERGRVYTRGGKERKDTGTSPSSHGSRQGAVSKQGRKKRKTKETESPKIRDQGSDTEIATEETVKKPEMTPQAPEVTPQAPEVTPKELEVKPEVAPPMTADVTSQPAPVQDEAETSVVASMSENEVQPPLTTDAVKPTEEDVSSVVDTPKPVADESSTTLINPAQTIEVIGADENTESATLSDATSSKNLISPASSLTQSAYDSIAKMDQLQNELIITEERAQKAEDRVNELEANLNGANEKIRALEKQVAELMKQLKNTKESPEAEVVADSSSQKLTEDDSSKAGGKSLEGRKSSTPSRQSTSSQQKHRKSKSKKQ